MERPCVRRLSLTVVLSRMRIWNDRSSVFAASFKLARRFGTASSWAQTIMKQLRLGFGGGIAADRDRAQLRDRSRDYRQECADRGRRRHYTRRKTGGFGCRQLLHSRRDRRSAKERGDSGRVLDLGPIAAKPTPDGPQGRSLQPRYSYRRPAVFNPAADPSRSHFVCSFHGKAVSREAAWIGDNRWRIFGRAGCNRAPNAGEQDIFMNRLQRKSEISASINDSISRLNLDATGQARGNDIADSGGRFN